jgi:hypothetical protein
MYLQSFCTYILWGVNNLFYYSTEFVYTLFVRIFSELWIWQDLFAPRLWMLHVLELYSKWIFFFVFSLLLCTKMLYSCNPMCFCVIQCYILHSYSCVLCVCKKYTVHDRWQFVDNVQYIFHFQYRTYSAWSTTICTQCTVLCQQRWQTVASGGAASASLFTPVDCSCGTIQVLVFPVVMQSKWWQELQHFGPDDSVMEEDYEKMNERYKGGVLRTRN